MRLSEILREDYNLDLQSDLNNLLVAAMATGARDIKTTDLVKKLQTMGYSIGTNSLISLLANNSSVTNVTPDVVTFSEPSQDLGAENPVDDSAEKVKSLAAKATKIG